MQIEGNGPSLQDRILQLLGLQSQVYYIGGSDTLPAPLSRAEEEAPARGGCAHYGHIRPD